MCGPGAVRVGVPALTTRGFTEDHFRQVASFLDRALKLGLSIQATV
jgi:glycine hydroxymethyltransferase